MPNTAYAQTQTRVVECRDQNGNAVADSFCTGLRPVSSQSCAPACTASTETRTSTPCPAGETGLITEQRTINQGDVCGVNSNWTVTSNTCAATQSGTPAQCGRFGIQAGPHSDLAGSTPASATDINYCSKGSIASYGYDTSFTPACSHTDQGCPYRYKWTCQSLDGGADAQCTGLQAWSNWGIRPSGVCSVECGTGTVNGEVACINGGNNNVSDGWCDPSLQPIINPLNPPKLECSGFLNGTPSCQASCGIASGQSHTSAPSSNLCGTGNAASGVTLNGSNYTWTCSINGDTKNCNAPQGQAPTERYFTAGQCVTDQSWRANNVLIGGYARCSGGTVAYEKILCESSTCALPPEINGFPVYPRSTVPNPFAYDYVRDTQRISSTPFPDNNQGGNFYTCVEIEKSVVGSNVRLTERGYTKTNFHPVYPPTGRGKDFLAEVILGCSLECPRPYRVSTNGSITQYGFNECSYNKAANTYTCNDGTTHPGCKHRPFP